MAEYYLVSQLPSLDGLGENAPLAITEERFVELCERHLGKKARETFENITLLPPKTATKTGSAFVDAWNEAERALRLALESVRAEKQGKLVDTKHEAVPISAMQTARTALEMESPMEAELFLHRHRLAVLESLRPMDTFSEDYVFYYGIKLKLVLRIRQFDNAAGRAAYQEIYHSIMSGNDWEDVQ